MKLSEVAKLIHGQLRGDPLAEITGAAGLEDATEGDVSFVGGKKYEKQALASSTSCLIVKDFIESIKDKAQIKVDDPQDAFCKLILQLRPRPLPPKEISQGATIAKSALIADNVTIMAGAFISEDVAVGKNSIIYPGVYIGPGTSIGESCVLRANVVIEDGVTIGNNVTIHAGSVIGADGFGYMQRSGKNVKIPQVGGVTIGNDVEIGAGTAIDRAATGQTIIGNGVKIDNLVQLAHNVSVGENSIIVAQAGIAGSTTIGNYCMIGGQVAVADHIKIEDQVMLAARSGVMSNLTKGIYSGAPTLPHREWLRATSFFAKLPLMNKRITELEKKSFIPNKDGE